MKFGMVCGISATVTAAALTFGAEAKKVEGPDHECTSWMVFSDLTGNNTHLLHKNRDASSREIAVMKSGEKSPRKWIGLGTRFKKSDSVCMGMNASGLAAVVNSGEFTHENTEDLKWKGRPTPALLRDIIENCDTAAQAVERLKGFIEKKDYSHKNKGSIFFFTDTREGYIVELTAGFVSPQRYDNGYTFRANIWHNPGMAQRSRNTWKAFYGSVIREHAVITSFHQALRRNGRFDIADSLKLARNCETPKEGSIDRRVCYKHTNSSSTLVIDREFPDVLSVGYMTIGHPRNTICVPIPICVEKLDKRMEDLTWSKADWARFDKLGFDASIPKSWLEFEEKSRAEYDAKTAEARKLLKAGKRAEAVALLNASAAKIWEEAAKLLGI